MFVEEGAGVDEGKNGVEVMEVKLLADCVWVVRRETGGGLSATLMDGQAAQVDSSSSA